RRAARSSTRAPTPIASRRTNRAPSSRSSWCRSTSSPPTRSRSSTARAATAAATRTYDVFYGAGEDPLGFTADWTDGVRSVVVGVAGNRSLETGQAIAITDLDLGPAARALKGNA